MGTKKTPSQTGITRRFFIGGMAGLAGAPAIITGASGRTRIVDGIASGDISSNSAVIWGRSNISAKMLVEWSTTPKFDKAQRVAGPMVTARTGYTGQVTLNELPSGQEIFYRVRFGDQAGNEARIGHLRTPGKNRDVSFVFGGDQCGAGWGINPEWGGLRLFETMRLTRPDFLIHLGDRIYADRPIHERASTPDGEVWKNIITPAKSKVAESVADYRGNYSYNFLDKHYRKFSEEVPALTTWDDHEVTNDWWPGRKLSRRIMFRKGYIQSNIDVLARYGRQAFFEFTPVNRHATDPNRLYRQVSYGQNVDVFLLDSRSYRSRNNRNRQTKAGSNTALLGRGQIDWLKESLSKSKALWKLISSPLPIAHERKRERPRYDKFANSENGRPLGREHEIAEILAHIKTHGVTNTVWLAADVHYSAAHHFQPDRAAFKEFDPFWEFISGPFHTRPGRIKHLDTTFGPERFFRTPRAPKGNLPPSAGYIYFGHGHVDAKSGTLTISFRDVDGKILYEKTIIPKK
ncbi:MAG: alkaline phosphatase [Rhodospirillaceae bacterium]|nr:alkaline phosphatase [Rhodospirillaceae bacterium]|tara:strand:+ start:11392 stop:12945 length:1554 start_codon:yes stop_codon:yes gene_type:complete